MKFYKKEQAIKTFEKISNSLKKFDHQLFCEDLNSLGCKCFYVTCPENIYSRIKDNKESNFYETWTKNSNLYFSLDLDIKIDSYEESMDIVKSNINKVILGFKNYYNVKIDKEKIIVLESDSKYKEYDKTNKFSFHVIFRGIYFENFLILRDFFRRLNKDYQMLYCDNSIYNETCLRLCYNSKFGKKSILIPIEIKIDNKITKTEFNSNETPYNFWLETMITKIDIKDEMINKDKIYYKINKQENVDKKVIKDNVKNVNLEHLLFKLPSKYYDEYNFWIKIGLILNNIDNNNFKLWCKWSAQSNKYKEEEMESKWNNFSKSENKKKTNLGTLIYWAQKEKIDDILVKKNFQTIIEEYPEKPIIINSENIVELDQSKLEPEIFEKYIDNKVLFVQSEKGTGKTSNLIEYLFNENNSLITSETKILVTSSRRTFGLKLLGDLKSKGFKLYSEIKDSDIVEKRIICQIDSLLRLSYDEYDYIIIDEAESMARYLSSPHFIKNPKASRIKEEFEYYIKNSEKIIVMDADLSDRCINYYKNITNVDNKSHFLIKNNYKAFKDYEIVSMYQHDWINKIMTSITENKKMVIAMASNNKAKDLEILIKRDYVDKKILLIHKETKDEDKIKNLNNVNTTWIEYDIIIYTPSVCMGVSFDIPDYFDNIFGYGCEKSLGAQEFAQMLHRVREPKDKKIYLSLDKYQEYKSNENLTYKEVEEILCSDYYLTHYNLDNNTIIKKKDKCINPETNKLEKRLVYPYKQEPIYDLYVRNSWETIENTLNFGSVFYGYIKHKEYKISFLTFEDKSINIKETMKEIKETRENEEKENLVNGILQAVDITKEDFVNKIKQRDEYINDKDKFEISRYSFKKCYDFTVSDITKPIIFEYHNKQLMKWYSHIKTILSTEKQTIDIKLQILKKNHVEDKWLNNCYLDLIKKNNYSHHYYVITIIRILNFNLDNLNIEQNQEEIEKNVNNGIQYFEEHKHEISYKYDLKQYKTNILEKNFKDKLKILNTIINAQYGYDIKKNKNKNYQLQDNNLWNNIPRENKIIVQELQENEESKPSHITNFNDLFNDE